jgi:hypothetical protein
MPIPRSTPTVGIGPKGSGTFEEEELNEEKSKKLRQVILISSDKSPKG